MKKTGTQLKCCLYVLAGLFLFFSSCTIMKNTSSYAVKKRSFDYFGDVLNHWMRIRKDTL